MITLCVIETELTEEQLFLKLLSRGRQADIPYYFSVDRYNWEEGWIIFIRLDLAPESMFRVGVSGSQLIVSQKDILEISQWLLEWNIRFDAKGKKCFQKSEEALAFLKNLRKTASSEEERVMAGKRIEKAIIKMNESNDADLLARTDSDTSGHLG
ncbi:hypothetical protein KJ786_01215 [Patescibacteria group bacterium]|nr:hypothetical protein [Patescibacteria group bacterium]